MPDQITVPPEHVVEVLGRTEMGRALWRAATFEALAEVQQQRIDELERTRTAGPAGA